MLSALLLSLEDSTAYIFGEYRLGVLRNSAIDFEFCQ